MYNIPYSRGHKTGWCFVPSRGRGCSGHPSPFSSPFGTPSCDCWLFDSSDVVARDLLFISSLAAVVSLDQTAPKFLRESRSPAAFEKLALSGAVGQLEGWWGTCSSMKLGAYNGG